jgi:hypothetical protein
MASTYSPDLRLELIGPGEQSGVWGSTTNLNLGSLVEQAVAGVETIAITSTNQAITAFYGAVDQSRNAVLVLSSSAPANVFVPPVSKIYIIRNAGAYPIAIYNSTVLGNTIPAGSGLIVPSGVTSYMFTDGNGFYLAGIPAGATTGTQNVVYSESPSLTGTPTAPTANVGTNTTQIATTAFVTTATGTLGTMSTQNANAVAITGGAINALTVTSIGTNSYGTRTVSTSGPSGGSDGDIWYQVS